MAYHGIQLTIARQKAQDQGSPAPLLRAPEAAPGLRQSRLTIATFEELDDGTCWCAPRRRRRARGRRARRAARDCPRPPPG